MMNSRRRLTSCLFLTTTFAFPVSAQVAWQPLTSPQDPTLTAHTTALGWDDSTSTMLWLGTPFATGGLELQRFDGTTWSLQASSGTPPPNVVGADWDSDRNVMVVLSTTGMHEWNTGVWQTITAAPLPQGGNGAMCYDSARQEMLYFGGSYYDSAVGDNVYLDEMWAWKDATWTLRATDGPLARGWSAMGFDPLRKRVVMHGGWWTYIDPFACPSCDPTVAIHLNDTWEWDGSTWVTSYPGPGLKAHDMVYDPVRDRMVMFGGSSNSDFSDRTYELDGTTWTLRNAGGPPGARNNPRMVFDPVRKHLHMMGGYHSRDQWTYSTPFPAEQIAFGAGCGGVTGSPDLAGVTLPYIDDDWVLELNNLPPAAAVAFFVHGLSAPPTPLDLSPIGMPMCFLYTNQRFSQLIPVVGGRAMSTLPIGNAPVLGGLVIFSQAFVSDATANGLGLATSQALASRLGIR